MIYCSNCGAANSDNSVFCAKCGARLEASGTTQDYRDSYTSGRNGNFTGSAPQGGSSYRYESPMYSNQPESMDTVLMIVAIVFGVFYGIRAICLIPGIISNVGIIVFGFYKMYGFADLIVFGLAFLSCVILLAALLLFALLRKGENRDDTDPFFMVILFAAALRIVVEIVTLLIDRFALKISLEHQVVHIVLTILIAVLSAVLPFVLLIVEGRNPLAQDPGYTVRAIPSSVQQAIDEVSRSSGARRAERSAASGTGMGGASYAGTGAGTGSASYYAGTGAGGASYGNAGDYMNGAFRADSNREHYHVNTNRSLLMYIILSIITCTIYSWYFIYSVAKDVNEICYEDGKTTPGLLGLIGLSIVSCGTYGNYWSASLIDRLAIHAPRFGVTVEESGTSYILWCIPGVFLCGIGPFFAMHILIKNLNKVGQAYNEMYGV